MSHQAAKRILADQMQPSAVSFAWFRTRFLDESPEYLDDEGIHRLYRVYVKGEQMTPTEIQAALLEQTIEASKPLHIDPPTFDYTKGAFGKAVNDVKRSTKEPLTRKMKRAARRAARRGRRR